MKRKTWRIKNGKPTTKGRSELKYRYWWIWKGKIGRGMWPLSSVSIPKDANGPFLTKRDAERWKRTHEATGIIRIAGDAIDRFMALDNAKRWVLDSQMVEPFEYGDITPVKNTDRYSVTVTDAKGRSAICTFKADGSRDVFERTDRISGG